MNAIKVAVVDFESFYRKGKFDIGELGGYHYFRDPRADLYMVGIATNQGDEYVGRWQDFDFTCISGPDWIWVSHNARFDEDAYNAMREIDPELPPAPLWHCTADLVSYLQMPRALGQFVQTAWKHEMKKSIRDGMSGRHYFELMPFEVKELKTYCLEDARWCLKIFTTYGYKWPESERMISLINRRVGQKGVDINRPALVEGIARLKAVCDNAEKAIPWIAAGDTPLSRKGVAKQCVIEGIPAPKSMAKTSPEFDAWLDTYSTKSKWALAMRDWRSANALHAKATSMLNRIQPDGRMAIDWLYFGAHTGRFSGVGGVNFQNLPRGSIFGVDLRSMITPGPGHKLITCDAANIEFRTLMWLARDAEMLRMLADGHNPYEAVGRMLGIFSGEKGTLKKTKPGDYQMCKAIALGAGFSMGPDRFMVTARVMTRGEYAPTPEQAYRNIHQFRDSIPSAPTLWANLDKAVEGAANAEDPRLGIDLPSGRTLWYRDVQGEPFDFTALTIRKGNFARTPIYGGLLSENCSQALARDIFGFHMTRCYEAGIDICMHTHDELVCRAPIDKVEETRAQIESIMRTPPPWIPDIPLDVESEVCDFYKK